MKYQVSEKFYDTLCALLGVAIENASPVEIDLAMDLLKETSYNKRN
jgi:hypothetical protein